MKKLLFLALASLPLLFVSCEKDPASGSGDASQSDIVGTWLDNYGGEYTFSDNGTVVYKSESETETERWSYENGVLIMSENDGSDKDSYSVKFASEKAVMALGETETENGFEYCNYLLLKKKGATIKSVNPSDGRWDSPHTGIKPKVIDSEQNDYTACLIVKGSTMDMYIPAWGFHINATYTITAGLLTFSNIKTWQGIYRTSGSYGWRASGPPDEDLYPNWDYSIANMNPETFEIRAPWTVEEGDPMGNLRAFQSFDFIVTDDGKEAFAVIANRVSWFYKR